MDKKSVTETAADAAKVAVGVAAMAVDALMGADQTAKKNRGGTEDVGRQETAEAGASDQLASKIQKDRNNLETPQSRAGEVGGSGYAPAKDLSPSDAISVEFQNSSSAVNINKAKFDELVSLKHIGRGRAKRIIASRPFRSVDDLASQGIVPADILAELRKQLAV